MTGFRDLRPVGCALAVLACLALAACGGGGGGGDGDSTVSVSSFSGTLSSSTEAPFTIRGAGFTGTTVTVRFQAPSGTPFLGGTAAELETTATVESPTQVSGTSPAGGVTGSLDAFVEVRVGSRVGRSTDPVARFEGATFDRIDPATFSDTEPTPFTIHGTGFGPAGGTADLQLDALEGSPFAGGTLGSVTVAVTIVSTTEITGVMPPLATLGAVATKPGIARRSTDAMAPPATPAGRALSFELPDTTTAAVIIVRFGSGHTTTVQQFPPPAISVPSVTAAKGLDPSPGGTHRLRLHAAGENYGPGSLLVELPLRTYSMSVPSGAAGSSQTPPQVGLEFDDGADLSAHLFLASGTPVDAEVSTRMGGASDTEAFVRFRFDRATFEDVESALSRDVDQRSQVAVFIAETMETRVVDPETKQPATSSWDFLTRTGTVSAAFPPASAPKAERFIHFDDVLAGGTFASPGPAGLGLERGGASIDDWFRGRGASSSSRGVGGRLESEFYFSAGADTSLPGFVAATVRGDPLGTVFVRRLSLGDGTSEQPVALDELKCTCGALSGLEIDADAAGRVSFFTQAAVSSGRCLSRVITGTNAQEPSEAPRNLVTWTEGEKPEFERGGNVSVESLLEQGAFFEHTLASRSDDANAIAVRAMAWGLAAGDTPGSSATPDFMQMVVAGGSEIPALIQSVAADATLFDEATLQTRGRNAEGESIERWRWSLDALRVEGVQIAFDPDGGLPTVSISAAFTKAELQGNADVLGQRSEGSIDFRTREQDLGPLTFEPVAGSGGRVSPIEFQVDGTTNGLPGYAFATEVQGGDPNNGPPARATTFVALRAGRDLPHFMVSPEARVQYGSMRIARVERDPSSGMVTHAPLALDLGNVTVQSWSVEFRPGDPPIQIMELAHGRVRVDTESRLPVGTRTESAEIDVDGGRIVLAALAPLGLDADEVLGSGPTSHALTLTLDGDSTAVLPLDAMACDTRPALPGSGRSMAALDPVVLATPSPLALPFLMTAWMRGTPQSSPFEVKSWPRPRDSMPQVLATFAWESATVLSVSALADEDDIQVTTAVQPESLRIDYDSRGPNHGPDEAELRLDWDLAQDTGGPIVYVPVADAPEVTLPATGPGATLTLPSGQRAPIGGPVFVAMGGIGAAGPGPAFITAGPFMSRRMDGFSPLLMHWALANEGSLAAPSPWLAQVFDRTEATQVEWSSGYLRYSLEALAGSPPEEVLQVEQPTTWSLERRAWDRDGNEIEPSQLVEIKDKD